MITYRYYLKNRPPGIGTIPESPSYVENWGTRLESPLMHRGAWGCVEYENELTQEQIYNYELFVDMAIMPPQVHELICFARDEGIDEAAKELTSKEYGAPLMAYLKVIGRRQGKTGYIEALRAGLEYLVKTGV